MPRVKALSNAYRSTDFAKCVRSQLKSMELRQHDLAEELEVSDGMVTQILEHPERMSVDKLRKFVSFLKLSESDVLLFCGFTRPAGTDKPLP